ncbi:MAG: TraB/GumN family protein [Gammaproteobacteria bacterium]|nr:TraB/GumN family protein [Gammaproteobacteria bacterium]
MRPILPLLCLSALVALPVQALPLWEVTGRDNRVFLLGSIHFLREGIDRLPAAAITAYEDAELLVMELDLDDIDQAAVQATTLRYGVDPQGRTLEQLLGGAAWRRARDDAGRLGIDLAAFARFEPWLAALTITQIQLAAIGFDAGSGVEQQLLRLARRDGKEVRGLETVADQFAALDGLPATAQAAFLQQTIDEAGEIEAGVTKMLSAWQSGDTTAMEREFLDDVRAQRAVYRDVIVERNRNWLGKIRALLAGKDDVLIVVGTLHLVGPDSVIGMLEAAGYEVRKRPAN